MELQKLLLSLVLFVFFASVSYAYDIFKYELNYTALNLTLGNWTVVDFSEIANHIPLQADLSNVRVECGGCGYYLADAYTLLINNSFTAYITAENNYTKKIYNWTMPGEGGTEKILETYFDLPTGEKNTYPPTALFISNEYFTVDLFTNDPSEYSKISFYSKSSNYATYQMSIGSSASTIISAPMGVAIRAKWLKTALCVKFAVSYTLSTGTTVPYLYIGRSGGYNAWGNYGYYYVCYNGTHVLVYDSTYALKDSYTATESDLQYVNFIELYTPDTGTQSATVRSGGVWKVVFFGKYPNVTHINASFLNLQQVNPYYLCVDYDFPTPENATSKAKYSFKFLNVTNNIQILEDLNLTKITSINVIFQDYKDGSTLQTSSAPFGNKTFITFNNTNYPLIQRAWDFSDISWCWKPVDFDASHYIRVPTTDEARLLKIYVQPPEAGYWVYLYKDTSPEGMIDIRSTDPNGGVYYYVPESDWWILKIYDKYGNLTYSYEGELPDTTYNIYISLGGMISSTELTPEEISRISKYPIELEDPMVFEFDESVGGKVTKVEWYYFIGNVLYEKSYNYSPYTTEVTIDLSDELNASKIWFIFTFEDGKTWVVQYLNETYKAVSEGIEEVRSAFQNLELQFLAIIVFLSVYLLVLIYSPSEYLHIASAIGGIIFLAFIGVLDNLYIVGGLNIIIFLAGIGMVRYNV